MKFKVNNEELFLKAQQGDESAREELLVENDRLCYHIARKFENTKIPIDDLASMCRIGLIKSFNTFKPEKKIKFATYATRIMTNEILMHLRRVKKIKMEVSINQPLNVDYDGNELTVEDVYASPEPDYTFDDYETAKKAIEIFNSNAKEKYKQVFQLRIIEGKTQEEAGEILGISQSYVARITMAVKETLQYIAKTGKYKFISGGKIKHKEKINKMEELDMAKNGLKKCDFRYIFENYPKLTTTEIAKLTGYKKQSVINYKSFYRNGKWSDVIPAINHELMEKINNYIIEQKIEKVKRPSTISDAVIEAANQVQLDKINKLETSPIDFEEEKSNTWNKKEAPVKEIAKEKAEKTLENIKKAIEVKGPTETAKVAVESYKKEKEKNIIIKNQVALMSNDKDEISDLIYGIYQMIKNSPKGEVKIELSYEVRV